MSRGPSFAGSHLFPEGNKSALGFHPRGQGAPCGLCCSQTYHGANPWPSCLHGQGVVLAVLRNPQASLWAEQGIREQADSVQAHRAGRWPLLGGVLSRDASQRNLDLNPLLWVVLEYVHLWSSRSFPTLMTPRFCACVRYVHDCIIA